MPERNERQSPREVGTSPRISEETIRLMLAQQSKEADLRSQELALRAREIDRNAGQAEKILGAQERDREAERTHMRRIQRGRLFAAVVVAAMLIGMIIAGMHYNKDALVSDIIKILGSLIVGAFGGYGLAKSRDRSSQDEDD